MTRIKVYGDTVVAEILGDLDHHSASLIREDIDREINCRQPQRLVIDFSGVTFMDSSGIGLIMGRYRLMQELGGEVMVACVPGYIRKVLRLAGIDRLTGIADSVKSIIPEKEMIKEEQKDEQTVPWDS
ncbi:MAG: STAS domain-containing protein [Ruminococcus sp.]|nr:STAS domain-containing protein [Ruminococcus sp.]